MAISAIMCDCDSMSFDVLVNQFCSLQNGYTAVFYHCKQYPHQLAVQFFVSSPFHPRIVHFTTSAFCHVIAEGSEVERKRMRFCGEDVPDLEACAMLGR